MSELQFEHEDSNAIADIDSIEMSLTMIGSSKSTNAINYDTRRKIENLLEEKALRKLLEDDYDF